MADFHQPGCVATLHRLAAANAATLERELETCARRRPIALVLPCLFAEFSRPALHLIIDQLRDAHFVDTIVLSLGKASSEDLAAARRAFADLPQRVHIIWNDGPEMQAVYAQLAERGVDPGPDGKGRSCWIGYAHVLAEGRCPVVAFHDCDITTYNRELVARLCYPLVHPDLDFEFAKGYYARINGSMNGRVTRLFVTPLLRGLDTVAGPLPLLSYLQAFRYPLAGEFAMRADLARVLRLPANWGLEVGLLAEVHRHAAPTRVCQTEVSPAYDHKHQVLSPGDVGSGLLKMAVDIAQMLFRSLAGEGVVFSDAMLKTLLARYTRLAEDTIDAYAADACINGLAYNRHREEEMVEAFGTALRVAATRHLHDPLDIPMMPTMKRVYSAIPSFGDLLLAAVAHDNDARVAA